MKKSETKPFYPSRLHPILMPLFCLAIVACNRLETTKILTENSRLDEVSHTVNQTSLTETDVIHLSLQERWIIDATEAKQLIEQGALLLDARGRGKIKRLQGAITVHWKQFSPSDPRHRGQIIDDDEQLTEQLQALGISTDTPVVVFANPPDGWGEDGRIVWMLRTLGHSQAVMVDGGLQALLEANFPIQKGQQLSPLPGDFVVKRNSTWTIERDELREQLSANHLAIIDSREPREFAGRTPYGEQRGGHVPGAVNLYFKEFLHPDGTLLSSQDIIAKLAELGITADTEIVVYCTGGIRSGWLASVLVTLGFQVKNYAGSMWEWSASPAERYPLN